MATTTAVIVICGDAVLIWAIPHLSPQAPQPTDFFDHNLTHMPPPLFTIPFPQGITPDFELVAVAWNTISSWYFGSSHPLYFDMMCHRGSSILHKFKIILKPDLSSASLQVINTFEATPHDFFYVLFDDYRICEDTLVSCWINEYDDQCGVYTGSASANIISQGGPAAKMLLPDSGHYYRLYSVCPASGKLVCLDASDSLNVVVLDFF
jgi:hypothetical protein